ncbi:MAG: response regulator [Calditrichaeota bacterium]|nr:MAG: response regulator [Calditrichota bacterium]
MEETTYKALILDDEQELGETLSLALEEEGIQAIAVTSVDEAIQELKNASDFDIVISDIYLPEKSGKDFFEYSLTHFPDLPFIFITGNPNFETAVDFLKKGAYDYISKPFLIPQFIQKVKQVIEEAQRRKQEKYLVDDLRAILENRFKELRIYQDLFESKKQGVLILDSEGVVVRVNPWLEKFIGKKEAELKDHPIAILNEYLSPSLEFPEICETIFKNGEWKRELRAPDPRNPERPLIFNASIIPVQNEEGATFAYSMMLDDITSIREVESRLIESLQRTNLAQEAIIFGLARLAEYRDQETGYHLERIRNYCKVLAEALSVHPQYRNVISDSFIETIYRTAPLHDIGKVGIPDYILLKPDRLTPAEYEIMKTHTLIGYQTLNSIREQYGEMEFLNMGIDITYCHHEKFDGTGYPRGLKGDQIPLSAQIVAIADVYDALTSTRTYKKAFSHELSLNTMRVERGKHFDPQLFDVFLSIADQFNSIREEFKAKEKLPSSVERNLTFDVSAWDWLEDV